MKTLSEWLDHHISRQELNNNCFDNIAPSSMGEYRKSRRFPKWIAYKTMCRTFDLKPDKEQFYMFKDNFVRNGKL